METSADLTARGPGFSFHGPHRGSPPEKRVSDFGQATTPKKLVILPPTF
jgi:hypothetical protein